MFHAGLPAWRKAGNIVVSNSAGIEGFDKAGASYILIDLRSKSQVEAGHIPKAVAVPEGGVAALKDQFPKFKGAAIILYADDDASPAVAQAFKTVAEWDYKQVSVLEGGFKGWEKAGKQIAKGPAQSKIDYVRKLMPGEVDVAVLREFLVKPQPDVVLLDVRNAPEVATGALPNTLNIPLEELESRTAELPKDKKLVLHCATGARAEMAYNVLKKAGVEAGYLKIKVEFDKDDKTKYTIEE